MVVPGESGLALTLWHPFLGRILAGRLARTATGDGPRWEPSEVRQKSLATLGMRSHVVLPEPAVLGKPLLKAPVQSDGSAGDLQYRLLRNIGTDNTQSTTQIRAPGAHTRQHPKRPDSALPLATTPPPLTNCWSESGNAWPRSHSAKRRHQMNNFCRICGLDSARDRRAHQKSANSSTRR